MGGEDEEHAVHTGIDSFVWGLALVRLLGDWRPSGFARSQSEYGQGVVELLADRVTDVIGHSGIRYQSRILVYSYIRHVSSSMRSSKVQIRYSPPYGWLWRFDLDPYPFAFSLGTRPGRP